MNIEQNNIAVESEKETAKKNFIEQIKTQGTAALNLLKFGATAGFLSEEDVVKIKNSFKEAGWVEESE